MSLVYDIVMKLLPVYAYLIKVFLLLGTSGRRLIAFLVYFDSVKRGEWRLSMK